MSSAMQHTAIKGPIGFWRIGDDSLKIKNEKCIIGKMVFVMEWFEGQIMVS